MTKRFILKILQLPVKFTILLHHLILTMIKGIYQIPRERYV